MNETPFKQVIQTEADLREILGHPMQFILDKIQSELDEHCRNFIAKSPFLLISSADSNGHADVSPKGDPPGFVRVYNEKTLLIPDRPGNRLADTLTNILQNPQVGLIFLVPGRKETLRVNGTAQIIRDDDLREQFAVNGKAPALLIAITVREAFFHCTKCVVRSQLWAADDNPDVATMASLAAIIKDQNQLDDPLEVLEALVKEDEREGLY